MGLRFLKKKNIYQQLSFILLNNNLQAKIVMEYIFTRYK